MSAAAPSSSSTQPHISPTSTPREKENPETATPIPLPNTGSSIESAASQTSTGSAKEVDSSKPVQRDDSNEENNGSDTKNQTRPWYSCCLVDCVAWVVNSIFSIICCPFRAIFCCGKKENDPASKEAVKNLTTQLEKLKAELDDLKNLKDSSSVPKNIFDETIAAINSSIETLKKKLENSNSSDEQIHQQLEALKSTVEGLKKANEEDSSPRSASSDGGKTPLRKTPAAATTTTPAKRGKGRGGKTNIAFGGVVPKDK